MTERERGRAEGRAEVIDRIEWYAKNAINHAKTRIHEDGTALDARQKAMLESGERLLSWSKALRHGEDLSKSRD